MHEMILQGQQAPGNDRSRPAGPGPDPAGGIRLSVVVPTFRERDNVAKLVAALDAALAGIEWELIFVDDDSPDGTADAARAIAATDRRVRCLRRIGRRGLSSACVEGMLASSAPYIAVIDGDLQHDERLLPRMLEALERDPLDIVIGSRYVAGGSIGDWSRTRSGISSLATRISGLVVPSSLHDPMSGFFVIRHDAFMASVRSLSALGFKILVDLFASSPTPLRFRELPYQFRSREAGESKLDTRVAWDFGLLLLDKLIGRWIPVRFVSFAAIGGAGVLVHMVVLTALLQGLGVEFVAAQSAATLFAMVFNFSLNNLLTYRDRRLAGWAWWRGLASFVALCGIGAVANVGIAEFMFSGPVAGDWALSALAGIVVGAVWNYALTSAFTWGKR